MLLTELYTNVPDWMEQASCKETDLDPLYPEDTEAFKKLCESCPVLKECRSKYENITENGRDIKMGIFHAKDYGDRT